MSLSSGTSPADSGTDHGYPHKHRGWIYEWGYFEELQGRGALYFKRGVALPESTNQLPGPALAPHHLLTSQTSHLGPPFHCIYVSGEVGLYHLLTARTCPPGPPEALLPTSPWEGGGHKGVVSPSQPFCPTSPTLFDWPSGLFD